MSSGDIHNDWSTLVQVMAWCHQASSHYLRQCWFRSLLVYGVTTPIWVNLQELGPISQSVDELINQIFWKFSFYFNFNDSISLQICTCHNSSAVVTCAKKWTDWSDNSCSYKSNLYIDNIWIRSSNIVVKWVTDIIHSVHACDVYLLVWFFMCHCVPCVQFYIITPYVITKRPNHNLNN